MAGNSYLLSISRETQSYTVNGNMAPKKPRQKKEVYPRINPFTRFSKAKFLSRYRLRKPIVKRLAKAFYDVGFCSTSGSSQGGGISVPERFCLALRYFATGSDYTNVGDFQGVQKTTVSRAVLEVAEYFYCHQQEYISFPFSRDAREEKEEEFLQRFGLPQIFGVIDGTHVSIRRPSANVEYQYVNRKQYHSINVMVVADAYQRILHVDPCWPGSCNDAGILSTTEISRLGEQGFFGEHFIMGDNGYPQRDFLFVPVMNPTRQADLDYNAWHRSKRVVVENTFGSLKQRFRVVGDSGGYMLHTPDVCGKIIVACCCLHNVAKRENTPLVIDRDPDNRPVYGPDRGQPDTEVVSDRQRGGRGGQNLARINYITEHFE